MKKSKIVEEKVYNSSDLSFGCYNYRYLASYGDKEFDIVGFRRGIIMKTKDGYIDLITHFVIPEDEIISRKEFGVKDIELANSQIINIFKAVENDGYLATESILNLDHGLEKIITFKASLASYGYINLYPGMQPIINDVNEKSIVKSLGILFKKKH